MKYLDISRRVSTNLGHEEAADVGGPEHVHEQIVQLLDLLPLHSQYSEHQVTEHPDSHLHIHLPRHTEYLTYTSPSHV